MDLLLTVSFNWLFVDRNGSNSDEVSRHPVILILGKVSGIVTLLFREKEIHFKHLQYIFVYMQDIQHLPWESIPMLYDHPVTRVPSLQFLLSKVNVWYIACSHVGSCVDSLSKSHLHSKMKCSIIW